MSMDRMAEPVSYTQSNPLFDMSLSRSDLYNFQPNGEYEVENAEKCR